MKKPEEMERGAGDLGGRGPIMGIKGLVLQSLMRAMDERQANKFQGRGRRSEYAGGKMTGYPPGGAETGFDRHGR